MRRGVLLLAGAVLTSVLAAFGPATAGCGEGASPTNAAGSCETSGDQVQCGPGTATEAGVLFAGAEGAEFCNSGETLPIQGRVGAQQECECVYIDGDDDNSHEPLPLNGWARVDSEGVHCRQRSTPGSQSYNSNDGSDLAGCYSV